MELHNLRPSSGSTKKRKRIGRGQGSGRGGTSTRGHKGAKSRSGYKSKRGFEGGQMPLQMRLPKRGFKNFNRKEYVVFNVDRLEQISEKYGTNELSIETLLANGLINKRDKVKILGNGELTKPLIIKAHAASKSAQELIVSKGGSIDLI